MQAPVNLDPHLLSQRIKEYAQAVGFDKVGIVRAEALAAERRQLREWLARDYHGKMKWLERDPDQRSDPRAFFPAARSVIVVALNYYTPHQHQPDLSTSKGGGPATGKVSRYAWGDDYHEVLGEKLRALLAHIKAECPEAEGKVCVDIQPLMDKAWGVRAGLGWIGKHSNLITPEYGSWVFVGELLLNLELAYDDDRVADHCGTCTLCLEACPTGAITEPYVVDSRACLSYATIELRDAELPPALAGQLDGWLYGCDICQDVCPWNRFEQPSDEPRFAPRAGNINAVLSEIAQLTPESYAERFRHSAIKRAKLSGLQRNARTIIEHQSQLDLDLE